MLHIRCLFALFFMLILVSGCSSFVQDPKISIKEANFVGLDSSGVDVEFYLGITNPNNFDLSLLGYTYDLRVMTLPLSTGGAQETIIFPSGKETDMRLPVHLRFSNLLEIFKRTPDLDRLPYQMIARLQLKTPLGEMIIPLNKTDTLKVPERYRPSAAINRLRDALGGFR